MLSALFLVMVAALPESGRLVALAPLIGGVVLLWRFGDAVRPRRLPVAFTAVLSPSASAQAWPSMKSAPMVNASARANWNGISARV